MFNWIRKVLSAYIQTERALAHIKCIYSDNNQLIIKIIKSFSRKNRKLAAEYLSNKR